MQKLIQYILTHPVFIEKPPVLIDVGASGEIHGKWKAIAPYSYCIAFDADEREFGFAEKAHSGYLKLFVFNALVDEEAREQSQFYLTESPFCSSLLPPDELGLSAFSFAEAFKVKQVVQMRTTTLPLVLKELKVNYVDFFKTDSQGADLRIYKSLPIGIRLKLAAAEFEPGFINAYLGEDKLHEILAFMDADPSFWLAEFHLRYAERVKKGFTELAIKKSSKSVFKAQRQAPAWAEMTFLNTHTHESSQDVRGLLLGIVAALLYDYLTTALELAYRGASLYPQEWLFQHCVEKITRAIKQQSRGIKRLRPWLLKVFRKFME